MRATGETETSCGASDMYAMFVNVQYTTTLHYYTCQKSLYNPQIRKYADMHFWILKCHYQSWRMVRARELCP